MAGRILYAEDDPSIAAMVKFRLEADGHRVDIAEDGTVALERLEEHEYDVVLVDIMMPGMDGFALTREVAALDPKPLIIILSAKDRIDDVQAGRDAGADAYLTKPFDPEDLAERVEDHLAG